MTDGAAKTVCYLDNAATCLMPQPAIDALNQWCNRGNPSAEYSSALEARKMMETFRRRIAVECGFKLDGPEAFAVVFTSGASESNCHMIVSAVRSYMAKTGSLPHVITAATEHKSLLTCCLRLAKEKLCQLTVLPVAKAGPELGSVSAADLDKALRTNTCIVSIMAANNETGILNNLRELAAVAHRAKVPFHTDAVQLFGKAPILPLALGVDAFSISFHKLGGPPGVGLLVLRRAIIDGYDLCPHICGSQNGGLRGGTENLPGIGASFAAFRLAMEDRDAKTAGVLKLREVIKSAVASRVPCFYIDDHPADAPASIDGGISPAPPARHNGTPAARRAIADAEHNDRPVVFWIAPKDPKRVLPGILLIAVRRPGFCNRAARASLEKRGVIVSLGSACNTHDAEKKDMPSSVVVAMDIPAALRGSVLRVSLCDETTVEDVKAFVRHFLAVISSRECLSAEAYAAAERRRD